MHPGFPTRMETAVNLSERQAQGNRVAFLDAKTPSVGHLHLQPALKEEDQFEYLVVDLHDLLRRHHGVAFLNRGERGKKIFDLQCRVAHEATVM